MNNSANGTLKNNMVGGGKVAARGTKAQVFHGTARRTAGGLLKKDLMKHKGRIVSKRKHAAGKKAIQRLRKLGYVAKKGTFKLFSKSGRKGTRKMRGGSEGFEGPKMMGGSEAGMKDMMM